MSPSSSWGLRRPFLLPATVMVLLVAGASIVRAGPPFKTDDPAPVDFRHWEFYLASEQDFARSATNATCPHVEVNYGAIPDVQAHVVLPMGYVHSEGGTHYGFSDVELGAKWRFAEESDRMPQIGIFPLVELPTGNRTKELGQGSAQVYLPLWVQKSWGSLTMYGGAGVWLSAGYKSWLFGGWLVQYDFSPVFTFGGEAYVQSADVPGGVAAGGFSIGGIINADDHNHILFSIGRDNRDEGATTGYIGYQFTI